jgi:hypothetical protein
MTRVDVVVPCYNYGRYLRRCIGSILDQPGVAVRALVIDDCSTDNSEEVGRKLADEDPRVEYRRHPVNRGHIATYNEGLLGWADSDYVLLLSADDLLAPGALERAAGLMDAHPEVGFCHGRQVVFSDDSEDLRHAARTAAKVATTVQSGTEFIGGACANAQNPVATPTAIVRTVRQRHVGGYRPELPHAGDLEMWLRLATWSSVGCVEAVQAFKRIHGANMQCDYVSTAVPDLEQRRLAFESGLRGSEQRLPGCHDMLGQVTKALADEAFWAASKAFERGDAAMCREILAYGLGLDPSLRGRPEWRRLQLKRRLGPALWTLIRPVVDALRSRKQS